MGTAIVYGEATNNDSQAHSFTLKVSFLWQRKTAVGAVNDLAFGDTMTFTTIDNGDFSNADSYKVQVDTMVQWLVERYRKVLLYQI